MLGYPGTILDFRRDVLHGRGVRGLSFWDSVARWVRLSAMWLLGVVGYASGSLPLQTL